MKDSAMDSEDEHAAIMAVTGVLSEAQQRAIMDEAYRRWPRMRGALVSDILEYTSSYDQFLDRTEPFYELWSDHIPDCLSSAPRIAMHALILLGAELSAARIVALLQKAGVTATPRFAGVEVSIQQADGTPAGSTLIAGRAGAALLEAGGLGVFDEFEATVRHTGAAGCGRNIGDIAAWVTLVDIATAEGAPEPYDPIRDLARLVVTVNAMNEDGEYIETAGVQALNSLRGHMDFTSAEAAEQTLRALLGKDR